MTFDVEEKLAQLSVPDKIRLLAGLGWWHTQPVQEAGIPPMRMSDGPNGVRGTRFFNGVPSSCFPSSTGLGSTFDVDLARKVGEALVDECIAKGCHILLAPTVNTQRSPLGGRSFESFSEDPLVNGLIAAAYINGLQLKGVSATIKHYVANDQEFERFSISSDVSERALREIYLKPFQIAIKKANPWALMSAYNRVNGVHVSENKWLLDDILRKEWGYKGMVMSDWIGVYSTAESIKAGLDLEMPGPTVMRGDAVSRQLVAQKLFPSDIDERVRKILELLKKAFESKIPFDAPEGGVDTPELHKLLRTCAADSIVLLKNEQGLLPLKSTDKKIAVIGPNAKIAMTSGGGSARLLESWKVSPLQGIEEAAKTSGAEVKYTIGATSHKFLPLLEPLVFAADGEPGGVLEFWNSEPSKGFASPKADMKEKLEASVWSCDTKSTNCVLIDGVVSVVFPFNLFSVELVPNVGIADLLGCRQSQLQVLVQNEDGDWELGFNISGNGAVFFEGELILDLSNPPPGDSFMGFGSAEVKSVVKNLKKGQSYRLEVRVSNEEFVKKTAILPTWGGLRLGGIRVVDPDQGIRDAVGLAKESDVVILVVGLNHDWESEGFDRKDMELPGYTNRLVHEVLRANPRTVVVNQSGSPVTMPWVNEASTLLQAFYGGNELGNGLADVLFGTVNPSAKLALTFPKRWEDSPSYPSYGPHGQEHGKILYNEGIFVGYRGFQSKSISPLFPFGFGLSYTQFTYSDLNVSKVDSEGVFTVRFKVQNTGNVDGREVAQVYITDEEASLPRAQQELRGFSKVDLKAGESKVVDIDLDRDALGFFDSRKGSWVAEKGKFRVLVGKSSEDIVLRGGLVLEKNLAWNGL
ncbi:hypothetical protein V5O48_011358 [Marasmius crinis-equi]|uniref:beta-glucosidase n=1 Tax=Marasmius crinis-equi TaxID=585013 RepID=A0ABR3F664_9AGAR